MKINSHNDDAGYTIVELLVAAALTGVLMTISSTFLIGAQRYLTRTIDIETAEQQYLSFNEDIATALSSATKIRMIGDSTSTTDARRSVLFDYKDPQGGCMAYEVRFKTGKPNSSYTSNIDYFEYRKGRYTVSATDQTPTCVKTTVAASAITWYNNLRWQPNPPMFHFYDATTAELLTQLPTTYSTTDGDRAVYSTIKRVTYERKATGKAVSSMSSGFRIPESGFAQMPQ